MLGQLVGDQSLERFRHEYEALLGALRTAQQSEQRLKAKCAALHDQIVRTTNPSETSSRPGLIVGHDVPVRAQTANVAKVQSALSLSAQDQQVPNPTTRGSLAPSQQPFVVTAAGGGVPEGRG